MVQHPDFCCALALFNRCRCVNDACRAGGHDVTGENGSDHHTSNNNQTQAKVNKKEKSMLLPGDAIRWKRPRRDGVRTSCRHDLNMAVCCSAIGHIARIRGRRND